MDALKTLLSTQGPGTSATLVIMHAKNQNTYAAIKRASDMHYGVRTVCAVGSKIPYYAQDMYDNRRGQLIQPAGFQHQHLDNLALKFNFKCGGRNHGFDDAQQIQTLLGQENQRRDTIVFGADVAHPPVGGGAGYPSIACVVASSDTHFQNFPGSMRLQAGRQEVGSPRNFYSTHLTWIDH
jgi:eukaryotic translation initiation factor 2C